MTPMVVLIYIKDRSNQVFRIGSIHLHSVQEWMHTMLKERVS